MMKMPEYTLSDQPQSELDSSAFLALKEARMHGTKLAVQPNGRVILEDPDVFEAHLLKDADRS